MQHLLYNIIRFFDIDTSIDIQYPLPITENKLQLLDQVEELNVIDVIKEEGLKYIAGYASFRFRSKFSFLGTPTKLFINPDNDWINYISRENIIGPCKKLFETAKIIEKLFQDTTIHLFVRNHRFFRH